MQRARYRLGEGITGRVVESGKPIVVPEASREPLLLNRAARRQDRQEFTFICVPLVINKKVVGALGVDLLFRRDRDYDRSLKFYKLVASMMAQAIKVSRMAEAERRRLVEENTHLKDELRDRFAFQHLIGTSAPIRQVLRPGGAGGQDEHHRAHPRRVGHRQGADRACDPLQLGLRAGSRSSR